MAYNYFDVEMMKRELPHKRREQNKGKELYQKGNISIDNVDTVYLEGDNELHGMIQCKAKDGKREISMEACFKKTEVTYMECDCNECQNDYYRYYSRTALCHCVYTWGMMEALKDFLKEHNLGDATDKRAMWLMQSFQKQRINQVISKVQKETGELQLEPRLILQKGNLVLSFRIGREKKYVVKNLVQFCENIQEGNVDTYGSGYEVNHNIDNFDDNARKWIGFLQQMMRDEEKSMERIAELTWRGKSYVKGNIELYGWRLDKFFALAQDLPVVYEYTDKMTNKKVKKELVVGYQDPSLTMTIEKKMDRGQFEGVEAFMSLPEFYQGNNTCYYIKEEKMYQLSDAFLEAIAPFMEVSIQQNVQFQVGRNELSAFYHSVLPRFSDVIDIVEQDEVFIQKHLTPEPQFRFYLDAGEGNITCSPKVYYEDKCFELTDHIEENFIDSIRLYDEEQETLFLIGQLFPAYDPKRRVVHCDKQEELMFQVMEQGVETLENYGEVYCTKEFKNLNIIRKVKVSVGVSVSSGLLDLEVTTEDVSQEDLLDILKHYTPTKKYYRLKNGDFLNVQDESIQMLAEMMETLRISPKEFAKGKMHLPLYRTLYLDKMLEEHEAVYEERDHHFKEIVKNFKTVKEADYQVPKSLQKTLRHYQKNGYKWMRTLENYGFGGILADDMGLGKTLQVITLLLARKEQKESSTSLVVCPASLVYNWQEEVSHYAPELKTCTLTGIQQERYDLLEHYKEYDVVICSYDTLKRDIDQYEGKEFDYEIIDEAQYIKNHTTAVAKSVKIIKAAQRMALTGTPIENRLSELWSIFDYLMPGFLYGYEVFKKEFESPIVKGQDADAMRRLQRMVAPFILRRLKTDVLKDLPDKLEENRYVRFEEEQQKLYDAQLVHMQTTIKAQGQEEFNKNKLQILAELTKLRQICCDPGLCYDNFKGSSAKLEACVDLIENAKDGGHKILLFSQFTSMLEKIGAKLTRKGISFYEITGSTPKEKRLQLVKEFNRNDTTVFLISLKAGGVGLNLTGADVVIHYDPWWNVAVQNQATDRAYRIGQTKKVTVYKMIAKGSIEEKIQKLQEAKKDLADQIVNGEHVGISSLSQQELLELLG